MTFRSVAVWRRWCSGRRRAWMWGRAALCARGRRPAPLMVLLVAPRVFRAPEAPAAREARRPHFVRRRASKPARALRSLRRPPHQWGLVADVWLGALFRLPATPRHHPRAPQPGPPIPPAPSTPVTLIVLTCCPGPTATHRHRAQPSQRSSLSPHPISHVIPPRLLQVLNSDRWNCNVFRHR